MDTRKKASLKEYNTFGIDVQALDLTSVTSVPELQRILQEKDPSELFIIGGGSNMLLTQNIDKYAVHINMKGYAIVDLPCGENEILLKVAGGENWHDFVLYCIDNNYGGVENLSLIPGNVGTAPIQNIGAYGVELKDVFYECEAVSRADGTLKTFSLKDCMFGYRDSVFKTTLKDQYVITSVTFRLTTKEHTIKTAYGAIATTLQEQKIVAPTIKNVSDAVIKIRQAKLPDPKKIGNSGSFFKNPVISTTDFSELYKKYPEIPHYPVGSDQIKVPGGWLIEQAGFKGKRYGDAGVHDKQALVLVNHGNATGEEIWDLALRIQEEVKTKFGLVIIPEVNVF
ncbi:UDP-N-acetylmuramate dehydrogenase [uncultured Dokdonia sp.]|uniref:UDP-N-acetylmuramate dehydrogenase n=1 Tax=uncultured Dokdonia sp. TaxID=575653 RepID=UPI002636D58F|nr:UDP-N-acetylmuramate dehydrogenase [uncultured Dokdonia sp.]